MVRWTGDMETEGFESVSDEGKYLVEVKFGKDKKSHAGDTMWAIALEDIESGKHVCWDNLVFNEKGKGIAFKKMSIMGVEKGDDGWAEVESVKELIGKRFYLHVRHEEYQGKTSLKPNSDAVGSFFGYEPEFENPTSIVKDDIPF